MWSALQPASKGNRHRKPPKPDDEVRARPHRRFNEDNGLVYQETEIVFPKTPAHNWIRDFKTPKIIKKAKVGDHGARSLLDMARSKCATEAREFMPEHFESIPWAMAKSIWDEIVSRHLESFYCWRAFASAYGESDEFVLSTCRYRLEIRNVPLSLETYYRGLTSTEQNWHVALRISPKQHTVPDLVSLSKIENLAVLDLSDGQLMLDTRPSVFEERILRTWSELAASKKAFINLKVLLLGWQDNVSDWIFQYLTVFPALHYIIVTDCKNLHQKNRSSWEPVAMSHGWAASHAKRSVKMLRPLIEDKTFYIGTISNCYYLSPNHIPNTNPSQEDHRVTRPLVECCIGNPRVWTHIVDEYPGTRTIWFERPSKPDATTHVVTQHQKRERSHASGMTVTSSPPSKRVQSTSRAKSKVHKQSAAKLLAEFGC